MNSYSAGHIENYISDNFQKADNENYNSSGMPIVLKKPNTHYRLKIPKRAKTQNKRGFVFISMLMADCCSSDVFYII